MRISDWSSDVCSSDLVEARREPADDFAAAIVRGADEELVGFIEDRGVDPRLRAADERRLADRFAVERDVGNRRVVIGDVHLRAEAEVECMMGIDYDAMRPGVRHVGDGGRSDERRGGEELAST